MTQNNALTVIGLTGGTGSGKSSVAGILAGRGGYVIDADAISREIMLSGSGAYHEVIEAFGSGIVNAANEIDRRRLGDIVFSDPLKRRLLENITHKYILREINARIDRVKQLPSAYDFIVVDAPLLIESGLHKAVDALWVVYADTDTRTGRIMARDAIGAEQAAARISSQTGFEVLRGYADAVIENMGDFADLERRVAALINELGSGKCPVM